MKVIEMKLRESLIEAVKEIQVDESDIIWVEIDKNITQAEFQRIQDIVSESFPINRMIVMPKGCRLRFDNPEKKINLEGTEQPMGILNFEKERDKYEERSGLCNFIKKAYDYGKWIYRR